MIKDKILLIGMPGSGKTTFSRLLSQEFSLPAIDMDDYIEQKRGKSISELFENGEEYFRDIESQTCQELSKREGIVIAAGGGIIKRPKNMEAFEDTTIVIFIDRPVENIISDIDTSFRPLLKEGRERLHTLYKERYNLYVKYGKYRVDNSGTIESTLKEMIEITNKNLDSKYI